MKKTNSILAIMILRLCLSILFFGALIIFGMKIYDIGRINNLGLVNGGILFVLIMVLMISWMGSAEGVYRYSDPVNTINRYKYIIIFCCQVTAMIFNWYMITNVEITRDTQPIYIFTLLAVTFVVLYLHSTIITNYRNLSKQEKKIMINNYKIDKDENLLEKAVAVKKSAYIFFVYMILIMVSFEYVMLNIATSVAFLIINGWAILKIYGKSLSEYYSLTTNRKEDKIAIILGVGSSTIGYVVLFLINKNFITFNIFDGRTPDEFSMVFILFYSPLYVKIINCYFTEIRMVRDWVE